MDDVAFEYLLFNAPALRLAPDQRLLVLSDLHMGDGSRADDLSRNEGLLLDALERWYLPRGYALVLNGDVEELQRFSSDAIRRRWSRLYGLFDRFKAAGGLYKIVGNHDEDLRFVRDHPYELLDSLRVETGTLSFLVYHGHQSSRVYSRYNGLIRAALRYLLKPLGIRNISSARSPRKRFAVERRAYSFSIRSGVVSVIGHTHRPMFESLSRFDYIKFEIERLCRDYPAATGGDRARIEAEVRALKMELSKLKRKEKRRSLQDTLYGDELPVPCLFNSGSAIGRKGITALELDREGIALVYWFTEGEGKHFVERGSYACDAIEGTGRRRAVLNQDRLDYVQARIALLS